MADTPALKTHPVETDFTFGVNWDKDSKHDVDYDASCLIFENGNLVDAVFFGNPQSENGGFCKHSGDNRDGAKSGDDESIVVTLNKVPFNVSGLVFIITAPNGTIDDVKLTLYLGTPLVIRKKPKKASSALVAFLVARGSTGAWEASQPQKFTNGKYWPDVFEDAKQTLTPYVHPDMLKEGVNLLRNARLVKGERFYLTPGLEKIAFSVGWDFSKTTLDVDASVVTFSAKGKLLTTIFYNHLSNDENSIWHTGDNRNGLGAGDDERIWIRLRHLSKKVQTLLFVVTIFSENRTFKDVRSGFCRITGPTEDELTKYPLTGRELANTNALVIGKLTKISGTKRDAVWEFQALAERLHGRTPIDVAQDLPPFARKGYAPPKRHLKITIVEGTNLVSKDSNGSSDPFVVVEDGEGKSVTKTKVVKVSLNPKWTHEFVVYDVEQLGMKKDVLTFTCWDEDPIGKDFMGSFTLPIEQHFSQLAVPGGTGTMELVLPLKAEKAKQTVSGTIKLRLTALV